MILLAVALAVVVFDVRRGRIRWGPVAGLMVLALGIANIAPWTDSGFHHPLATWFWQLSLLVAGVVMAVEPLISSAAALPGQKLQGWRGLMPRADGVVTVAAEHADLGAIKLSDVNESGPLSVGRR